MTTNGDGAPVEITDDASCLGALDGDSTGDAGAAGTWASETEWVGLDADSDVDGDVDGDDDASAGAEDDAIEWDRAQLFGHAGAGVVGALAPDLDQRMVVDGEVLRPQNRQNRGRHGQVKAPIANDNGETLFGSRRPRERGRELIGGNNPYRLVWAEHRQASTGNQ